MSDLKSKILIQAVIKYCSSRNIISTVVKKGDENNGVIWLKILRKDNKSKLLSRYINEYNEYVWREVFDGGEWQEEKLITDRITKEISFDSDLWVLEIENDEYLNPFERIL